VNRLQHKLCFSGRLPKHPKGYCPERFLERPVTSRYSEVSGRCHAPSQTLSENKSTASAITSSRDDEPTERRHGYQNYFFSLWTGPKSRTTVEVRPPHVSAVFTTAMLGLAPVRSTRASAVNPRKSISACRRDDLAVANSNVTPEVTDHACPQYARTRRAPAESRSHRVNTFGMGAHHHSRPVLRRRKSGAPQPLFVVPARRTTPRDLYRAT
jgi:hypothetical protein